MALLGRRIEQQDRQAVAQCLISKTIDTGEEVDIYFVLPFESSLQAVSRQSKEPEGAPDQFYRLLLASPSAGVARTNSESAGTYARGRSTTTPVAQTHPTDRGSIPNGSGLAYSTNSTRQRSWRRLRLCAFARRTNDRPRSSFISF